jgi:hypothetical protein
MIHPAYVKNAVSAAFGALLLKLIQSIGLKLFAAIPDKARALADHWAYFNILHAPYCIGGIKGPILVVDVIRGSRATGENHERRQECGTAIGTLHSQKFHVNLVLNLVLSPKLLHGHAPSV